jgi:aminoglycoside phosphotransferase (APT) family kinase protein
VNHPKSVSYSRTVHSDTAAVRKGEELDTAALAAYLRGKIPGVENGLTVEQFPGGHSNLTYLVNANSNEYVLRRAPFGPVAPKAHDMAREYIVLAAVSPHFKEAPGVYHICEDPGIIGAVFFLMERRRGVILRDSIPPEIESQPDHGARISEAFIDCLARMHAIDIKKTGLISLGKPAGFVERQVRGWADRWNRAKTEDLPEMDRVIQWLADRLPSTTEATLVHNDYKLDNVMLGVGVTDRIEAVLDWR